LGPVGNPEEEGEGEEKVEGVDVVEVSTVAVATEPFLLLWASDGFLPGGTDSSWTSRLHPSCSLAIG